MPPNDPEPAKPPREEVLDLTGEPVPMKGVAAPEQVVIDQVRENTRGRIAFWILGIIAGVIVGAFATIAWNWTTQAMLKDLLTEILTPLIGLLGAVIGFYFGSVGTGQDKK
jgi:uncharacterized protein YacL